MASAFSDRILNLFMGPSPQSAIGPCELKALQEPHHWFAFEGWVNILSSAERLLLLVLLSLTLSYTCTPLDITNY